MVNKEKIKKICSVDALTKHMAVEWGPEQIRVVGVAPGPVAETEGMRKLGTVADVLP